MGMRREEIGDFAIPNPLESGAIGMSSNRIHSPQTLSSWREATRIEKPITLAAVRSTRPRGHFAQADRVPQA
jgi:hypothetical protein